jgi:competence protein ComEC
MKALRLPFIVACGMIVLFLIFALYLRSTSSDEALLRVSFLDVGQGDAIFIESPTGTQVLIDGGKGSVVLARLKREMDFFDKDIDMVVATHPDQDHIEGLIYVLKRYKIHTILMTENEGDTPVAEEFLRMAEDEGARVLYARRGQVFDLGSGDAGSTTLSILFPDRDPSLFESNTASIVSRLVYGESEYLLTGDSPKEVETYLVDREMSTLMSDVLKLGHHGSRTSSSEIFVSAVSPHYAIISAGRDNSYGHPHKEVVDLLVKHNIIQKSTADLGSVISETDGKTIWFR